eukprot:3403046-Rhodomonas_salina.2
MWFWFAALTESERSAPAACSCARSFIEWSSAISGTRPPSSTMSTLFSALTARLRSVQPASSRMLSSRERSSAMMCGSPPSWTTRTLLSGFTDRSRMHPSACLSLIHISEPTRPRLI